MAGLIFSAPGSFTSPDDLPLVSLSRVEPLPGAMADWAVDRLPDGAARTWTDLTGAAQLVAPNDPQAAIASGGILRFDGLNDRYEYTLPTTRPLTFVIVARALNPGGAYRFFSNVVAKSFAFGTNAAGDSWTMYGDGGSIASPLTPDSNWHVFIVVANAENSIISVDGTEESGDIGPLGTGSGDVLRVGASNSAYYASEFKRLAIFPYAANADERSQIGAQMAAHYNVD